MDWVNYVYCEKQETSSKIQSQGTDSYKAITCQFIYCNGSVSSGIKLVRLLVLILLIQFRALYTLIKLLPHSTPYFRF